eukprot:scaffold3096_cov115-Isochrysis_galbana.AAC.1
MREQGALSRGAGGVADEPPLSLGACKPAPSVGSAQHSILESVVATHSLSSDHAGVCSLCTAAPAVKRSRDAGPRRPTGPPSSVATPVASRLDHATVPSRLADKTDRNPAHGRMEKMESACGRSSTSTRRCERDLRRVGWGWVGKEGGSGRSKKPAGGAPRACGLPARILTRIGVQADVANHTAPRWGGCERTACA